MAPLSLFQLVVADDSWRGEELETRGACEPETECLSVCLSAVHFVPSAVVVNPGDTDPDT